MPSQTGTVYIGSDKPGIRKGMKPGLVDAKAEGDKLENLAKKANLIVFEASSVSPLFSPFKNKITICPNRVTITYNSFFVKDEFPMPIENITGARVARSLLLATLYIDTFGIARPDPFGHLRINDARLARRYILALIECKKANIDLPCGDMASLREKLKSIGMVRMGDETKEYHNI